jgi:hypothetical protein
MINKQLPEDVVAARRIARRSKAFMIVNGELYKKSISSVLQQYVTPQEDQAILKGDPCRHMGIVVCFELCDCHTTKVQIDACHFSFLHDTCMAFLDEREVWKCGFLLGVDLAGMAGGLPLWYLLCHRVPFRKIRQYLILAFYFFSRKSSWTLEETEWLVVGQD